MGETPPGERKDNNAARHSASELLPGAYQDLRRLAASLMAREATDPVLQATALVHDVYIGMSRRERARYRDKHHFIATASIQLRRAILDHVRHSHADKRDRRLNVTLHDGVPSSPLDEVELLDLCQAMERLDRHYPRQCNTFALRFFGGLSVEECGRHLDVSPGTVKNDWKFASAWLARALQEPPAP